MKESIQEYLTISKQLFHYINNGLNIGTVTYVHIVLSLLCDMSFQDIVDHRSPQFPELCSA